MQSRVEEVMPITREFFAVCDTHPGGSGKAEGFADGGRPNYRQAAACCCHPCRRSFQS
jgi:hypothetical protein